MGGLDIRLDDRKLSHDDIYYRAVREKSPEELERIENEYKTRILIALMIQRVEPKYIPLFL